MAEVRYRGTKVVTVSPDYADNTKFADEWLPAQAGTDAALAMAMGHVILKEFFVDRQVPFFADYVRRTPTCRSWSRWTRTPSDGGLVAGQVPHRRRPRRPRRSDRRKPRGRPCCWTRASGEPVVPNGSMGFRYADSGEGKWNLDLEGVVPALSVRDAKVERRESPRCCCRASRRPTARAACCAAASRSAGSATTWSPPSST